MDKDINRGIVGNVPKNRKILFTRFFLRPKIIYNLLLYILNMMAPHVKIDIFEEQNVIFFSTVNFFVYSILSFLFYQTDTLGVDYRTLHVLEDVSLVPLYAYVS